MTEGDSSGLDRRSFVSGSLATLGVVSGLAVIGRATDSDDAGDEPERQRFEPDEEYGSWWYRLGHEEGDGSPYWQVIARMWNPDVLREEYRLRRPLVEDATPDSLHPDEWEVRMVPETHLGMSYQALEYRGEQGLEKEQELMEQYGDASSIDFYSRPAPEQSPSSELVDAAGREYDETSAMCAVDLRVKVAPSEHIVIQNEFPGDSDRTVENTGERVLTTHAREDSRVLIYAVDLESNTSGVLERYHVTDECSLTEVEDVE